jgi:hypothetical protein
VINPLAQYLVKVAGGIVALVLWVLSVTNPPVLALDPAAQAVLLGAAVVALGWGVVQGGQSVRFSGQFTAAERASMSKKQN